jgi:hypothetical protein
MADGPVGLGFDQRRPLAAPRALDGLPRRLPDRDHVVAVDRDARNAVGGRAGRDLGVRVTEDRAVAVA